MQRPLGLVPVTQSTLSLDSFASENATVSSASTFTGIGSLSGKAIFNVGKLTLKAIEQVIISRRLSAIATHFPHHEGAKLPGLTEMYMDLLELSRPELYPESIRIRALQMLVAQIASRSSETLVKVLSNWPVVELCLIIRDIASRIDPIRQISIQDPVVFEYQKHLSKEETYYSHSLTPFIDFLSALAFSCSQTFPVILSAGVQDLLLHLYVSDFRDPITSGNKTSFIRKSSLATACNSFLLEACSNPSSHEQLQHHPIHGLWSLRPMLSFGRMEINRSSQRREMWRTLGLKEIKWRISSAFDLLMDWEQIFTGTTLFDLLIDLVEFSGSAKLPDEICFRALRSLHCLIIRGSIRDPVASYGSWNLRMYFDQTPLEYSQNVFPRIIQRVSTLILEKSVSDSFYQFFSPDNFQLRENTAIHFIHWLTDSGSRHSLLREVLIQADIEGLLISTTKFVESLDGVPWQHSLSFGLDATSHSDAIYRAEVLSLGWWVLFRHPYSGEIYPALRLEASVRVLLEQIDRDHVYSWVT